jgi:hypothetical protein
MVKSGFGLVLLVLVVGLSMGLLGGHSVVMAGTPKKPLPLLAGDVFVLPSGNIHCGTYEDYDRGGFAGLRCDIHTPMKPTPKGACELDWTGLELPNSGKAHTVCAGDTVAGPDYPVLKYGQRWARQDVSCTAATTGLTCKSQSGHGFFLSRESWKAY